MVAIHTHLVPIDPSTGRRPRTNRGTNPVTTVTIHTTQNYDRGAGAETHSRVQLNGSMPKNSWQATVDERGAWVNYLDSDKCWHAGHVRGNETSYAIEIAENIDGDYRKAVANAAEYAAIVLRRNGLSVGALVQHSHWTGKDCPRPIRASRDGISWERFKAMVQAHLDGVDVIEDAQDAPAKPPAVSPSKPAPTPAGAPYAALLLDGSKGPVTVRAWQHLMTAIGRYTGLIDGKWGPLTTRAVQTWLKDDRGTYTGLVDGVWGPMSVTALQRFLTTKRHYTGLLDGVEGPMTVRAEQSYLNAQRGTWN